MTDGHEADDMDFTVDAVDDSKAADTILPQPFEFSKQRLTAFRIVRNGANGRLNGAFQIGVQRTNDIGDMPGNIRLKGSHAVRRFLGRTRGSPKTSSNERPFLPDR